MAFKIRLLDAAVQWDSLPIAKIIHYPLEKRDYKPYAQARFCMDSTAFLFQIWAFEVEPSAQSRLRMCFDFFPGVSNRWIDLSFGPDLKPCCKVMEGEKELPVSLEVSLHRYSGEDLQGIYWGGAGFIAISELEKVWGIEPIKPRKLVRGNLYKICDDPKWEHYGSFYPADFTSSNPYSPENFGEFELVRF